MKKKLTIRWLILLLFSTLVLLISASHTSPVYDLLLGDYRNNTASAAMVIGKYWAEGMAIPYKDLFSMGGPLYFFFQALGWFIAGRMGIFILEVISFTVFLWLIMQATTHLVSKKAKALSIIVGVVVYTALCSAGNSTFEWCIPFISGGYYIAFREKRMLDCKNMLLLGILCGCVLVIDFRAGGLLYGIVIWAIGCSISIFNKDGWKRIIFCIIGIITPILIAVYVFVSLDSLKGMLQGTFIYPIYALFSGFDSLLVIVHKGMKCLLLLPMLVAGSILLHREKCFASLGTGMLFSGVVCGMFLLCGDNQWYYYLSALPSVIVGIALLYPQNKEKKTCVIEIFSVLLVLGLAIVPLKNYFSFLKTGTLDVVNEFFEDAQDFEEENPDYRYFALDTDNSYFLLLDKMPDYRYFANQTELSSYDSAIGEEVEKYLNEGMADVVFITERGYIGRDLEKYNLTQVYLKYGGSLFIYIKE